MQDHRDTVVYTQLRVLASFVIIIYPVGVPVLYAVLLFLVHGRGGGGAAQMLGFLTRSYRVSPVPSKPTRPHPCQKLWPPGTKAPFFWWELVETAKKLLFSSFFALPFMGHGTLIQLLVATVLQLVFLVLQVDGMLD